MKRLIVMLCIVAALAACGDGGSSDRTNGTGTGTGSDTAGYNQGDQMDTMNRSDTGMTDTSGRSNY
jgi:uncharacterized lipoprotein YehR (DUF1307 family)